VLKVIKFDSFNPKLIDSKGMTPVDHLVSVSYLCIEGTEEALKLMLTHPQFDVSVINNSKFTSRLLSYIYISIGKTMLQSLLKYPDLNISRLCLDGTSILHEVYTRGDKETFNLLLEHPQVDLNIIYKNSTILHEAYSRDDMEAFHLLLSHPQLDLNKTYNNTNILNEVYRRNDMETFSLLLSNPRLNLSVVLEDDTILDQVLKRRDVQTYLMLSKSIPLQHRKVEHCYF
jgi:ankyrin repeat protein